MYFALQDRVKRANFNWNSFQIKMDWQQFYLEKFPLKAKNPKTFDENEKI